MTAEVSEKRHEIESEGGVISNSSGAVRARAGGASLIQVELGLGKSAVVLLWLSSFVSALATIGLIAAYIGFKNNVNYVNVLQYDLMDLRAKTGFTHENQEE